MRFEEDYFKRDSVYRKFSNARVGVSALTNYHYGFYKLIERRLPRREKKELTVLELGCGYSGLAKHFLDQGFEYTGLDISHYIIDKIRQMYPQAGFIEHDIQKDQTDLKDRFDLVVALEVLEHLSAPKEALKNIFGFLKSDGILVATVPNPRSKIPLTNWRADKTHLSIFNKEVWESYFLKAGFASVAVETIFTIPFFWRFHRIFSRVFCLPEFGASIKIVAAKGTLAF